MTRREVVRRNAIKAAASGTIVDQATTILIHEVLYRSGEEGDASLSRIFHPFSRRQLVQRCGPREYRVGWRISIPSVDVDLDMSTPLLNQEMLAVPGRGSPTFWGGVSRFGERERVSS